MEELMIWAIAAGIVIGIVLGASVVWLLGRWAFYTAMKDMF